MSFGKRSGSPPQFSLRSLLLAFVFASLYLSWLGWLVRVEAIFEWPVIVIYGILAIVFFIDSRTRVVAIVASAMGGGIALLIRFACYPIGEFSMMAFLVIAVPSLLAGLPFLLVLATIARRPRD